MATQQDLDDAIARAKTAEDALAVSEREKEILKRSKTVSDVKDSKARALPACVGKYGETFKVNPKGCRTCFAHVQCKKPAVKTEQPASNECCS